jgi:hypothetical protein
MEKVDSDTLAKIEEESHADHHNVHESVEFSSENEAVFEQEANSQRESS